MTATAAMERMCGPSTNVGLSALPESEVGQMDNDMHEHGVPITRGARRVAVSPEVVFLRIRQRSYVLTMRVHGED
jgi:hypothetical protein